MSLSPLAHLLRPDTLDGVVGQSHLLKNGPLPKLAAQKKPTNIVFWGPPGVGKTSLATILCKEWGAQWTQLNATLSSIADIKKVIDAAKNTGAGLFDQTAPRVLFIDELHRFSKTQQDALLSVVEDGTLTLIGATTENPRFSVIGGLLSRCLVFECKPLEANDMVRLITRAVSQLWPGQTLPDAVAQYLIAYAVGDGRKLCNGLAMLQTCGYKTLSDLSPTDVQNLLPDATRALDDTSHYDMASAFIKSMRGSDPQASIYWLARLLASGEDPLFVARRMVIFASEDIGNADPQAMLIAAASMQAAQLIGMPEARIPLAQSATYLACAPKSNAAYVAINEAMSQVQAGDIQPVPPYLRDRQSQAVAYDKSGTYKYPHDYPHGIVSQQYYHQTSPFYRPKPIGFEREIIKRMDWIAAQSFNPLPRGEASKGHPPLGESLFGGSAPSSPPHITQP